MSVRLDRLIVSSRALDGAWDRERAERVRAGALRRCEVRTGRDRLLRRGALVGGGAALLLVLLLRVASSAPAELPSTSTSASTSEVVAARATGDGGYARD